MTTSRCRTAAVVAVLAATMIPATGGSAPSEPPFPVPSAPTVQGEDPPYTVVVTRYARRGCEAAFETLWQQMVSVRGGFPGQLSSDFIRPPGGPGGPYHMIYRFDHLSHYQAWLASDERAAWLKRLEAVTTGSPQYQYITGLEAWVTPPGAAAGYLPERYKTTAVTWLAIFPLVLGVGTVAAPLTIGLSPIARTAIVTGIVVPAMSYAVMPAMTWLFRDWLYPPAPPCSP